MLTYLEGLQLSMGYGGVGRGGGGDDKVCSFIFNSSLFRSLGSLSHQGLSWHVKGGKSQACVNQRLGLATVKARLFITG